jgi:hypothetical protein
MFYVCHFYVIIIALRSSKPVNKIKKIKKVTGFLKAPVTIPHPSNVVAENLEFNQYHFDT